MDQRTRKAMTIHEALHLRDNIDRLYASRKEGGWGNTSIENSMDTSTRWFEDYIQKGKEKLITKVSSNTDYMRTNRTMIT